MKEAAYTTILSADALAAFTADAKKEGRLAVIAHGTAAEPMFAHVNGLALASRPGHAVYVPVGHRYLGAPAQLSMREIGEALTPVLADPAVAKIGHDLKYTEVLLRRNGIAAFDGVYNRREDGEGFRAEAREGRALGFDGKSLIHPSQIALCHEAFAPTEAEVERAQRLVGAFDGGAERFEDEMIERMHVEQARRILARSGG